MQLTISCYYGFQWAFYTLQGAENLRNAWNE